MSAPSESDLIAFRAATHDFLAVHASSERVRQTVDSDEGYDQLAWKLAATQLGLQGLLIAEADGGSAAGFAAAAIAAGELGAALLPGPYLPTLIGSWALAELGSGAFAAELAAVADGSARLAVALGGPPVRTDGSTLTGDVGRVAAAAAADLLVVAAEGPQGPVLALVDLRAPGAALTPLPSLDLTRPGAAVTLTRAPARTVALSPAEATLLLDVAAVLVAAEQVALIREVLDRTVAYSKERVAFGRPVGSFQAVKHQLAELYILLEQADSMLGHAVDSLDGDPADPTKRSLAAVAVQCLAGRGAVHATTEALRLLGGIGYTWEHDAHLFVRRAYDSAALLGSEYRHRARLADLLGLTTPA